MKNKKIALLIALVAVVLLATSCEPLQSLIDLSPESGATVSDATPTGGITG